LLGLTISPFARHNQTAILVSRMGTTRTARTRRALEDTVPIPSSNRNNVHNAPAAIRFGVDLIRGIWVAPAWYTLINAVCCRGATAGEYATMMRAPSKFFLCCVAVDRVVPRGLCPTPFHAKSVSLTWLADLSGTPGNQDFRIFSPSQTLAGNADLGARKCLPNGQKYLCKHGRWSEKGLILALLGGWRHRVALEDLPPRRDHQA